MLKLLTFPECVVSLLTVESVRSTLNLGVSFVAGLECSKLGINEVSPHI